MLSKSCPRCSGELRPVRLGLRDGGAYREAAGTSTNECGWQCARCAAGLVPGPLVAWLMRRVPVGGGPSERDRRRSALSCPACFGTFDRLLLGWGTSFVEIEQCPRCRAMLLDPGELPKVFVIEQDSQPT